MTEVLDDGRTPPGPRGACDVGYEDATNAYGSGLCAEG